MPLLFLFLVVVVVLCRLLSLSLFMLACLSLGLSFYKNYHMYGKYSKLQYKYSIIVRYDTIRSEFGTNSYL